MTRQSIRVLTLIESATVTGPSRNLIEFGKLATFPERGLPPVEVIVATYQRGSNESALAVAAKNAGLSVVTIAERRRWDIKVFPQLRQMVAEYQPDILESRNVKSHFLVRMLGLHKKCRWIAWNHGYTATNLLDRSYSQLDRWSLRGAYRVVTVCGPFADTLARRGIARDKITVLHNSVKPFVSPPLEQVQELRHGLGLHDEAVILAVGRLSHEKAFADLLKAVAVLSKTKGVPDFRVVVVGEGPERESLTRLAAQLGIEAKLTSGGLPKRHQAVFQHCHTPGRTLPYRRLSQRRAGGNGGGSADRGNRGGRCSRNSGGRRYGLDGSSAKPRCNGERHCANPD